MNKRSEYDRAYRETNRERIRQQRRAYYEANKERFRAYYETNREHIRTVRQLYLEQHPDRRRATVKKWYDSNKDSELARKRDNPNHVANVVQWQKSNREKVRTYKANNKAKRKAAQGELSADIVSQLFERQRGKCVCCQKQLRLYHVDHIVPLARGGMNVDENVQLLCRKCNISKSARHPVEFMRSIGLLF